MVTKRKAKGSQKKTRVKVGKLKLNKETVSNLTSGEQKQVKGGRIINIPSQKCSGDIYTRCATLCGSCGQSCPKGN